MTNTEELRKSRAILSIKPADGYRWISEIGYFVDSPHVRTIQQILVELSDPIYKVTDHGKRGTRNRGCRGPLCMYALRAYNRSLRRTHAVRDNRTLRYRRLEYKYEAADQIALMFIALIRNPQVNVAQRGKLVSSA